MIEKTIALDVATERLRSVMRSSTTLAAPCCIQPKGATLYSVRRDSEAATMRRLDVLEGRR